MSTNIIYILISAVIALILTVPITRLLYKYKIVRNGEYDDTFLQIPSRKIKEGTPIMGGLIIVLTIVLVTSATNFSKHYTLIPLVVLLLCAIIGAADDILNIYGRKRYVKKLRLTIRLALHHAKLTKRIYFALLIPWSAYKTIFYKFTSRLGTGLHPHEKVLVQVAAGALIAYWLYFKIHWDLLWLPGNHYINLGWLLIPLVIFMVVFMANAVNFADGLDGLSAGMLIPSFIVFMIIAQQLHNTPLAELCATTVGALLTYLYFNVKPARFEMGDVGSLALGALLATIAILLHREILLFFSGFLFVLEIASVIIQKTFKRIHDIKIFRMTPLHHHFELLGWTEEKVVMRFWIFSIVFAFISLLIAHV